jgi:hypothetical protein
MALEHETEVYHARLSELLEADDANEGKFTVIHGDDVRGPFDTYEAALAFGYGRYGLSPFLVQKIERHETALFFARGLR